MAKFTAVLSAAILAIAIAAASASDPEDVYRNASAELLADGRAALAEERYYDALSHFEAALVADPGSVRAVVAIGEAHEALGQPEAGLAYYRRALLIDPNDTAALEHESLALLAAGEIEAAEQNRQRLERICGEQGCAALTEVREAIAAYKAEKASMASAGPQPEGDSGGS